MRSVLRRGPAGSKRPRVWLIAALAVIAVIAGAVAVVSAYLPHTPRAIHLADGTDAYFLSDTKITPAGAYPRPRQIHVDGDAFIHASAAAEPLTVRTRLLVLTVTGESAFRVTAYSQQPGEQVEVLYGRVQANKSYASPFSVPDILTGGEMSMINRDIDLMEKETFDPATVRAWSERLIASANEHSRGERVSRER